MEIPREDVQDLRRHRVRLGRGVGRDHDMEGTPMKCPVCRSELKSRRESHRYTESGLPNVTLADVEVRHCAKCGEHLVSIPRIEELHRVLALELIRQKSRLTGDEVRFLRKYLGWSAIDFARHIGV